MVRDRICRYGLSHQIVGGCLYCCTNGRGVLSRIMRAGHMPRTDCRVCQILKISIQNCGRTDSKSMLGVTTSCGGSLDLHVPSLLSPFIKTYLNYTPWLYSIHTGKMCDTALDSEKQVFGNKILLFSSFIMTRLTIRATYCSARCLAHHGIYKKTLDQEKKKGRHMGN